VSRAEVVSDGIGDVNVNLKGNAPYKITDALYVPDITVNSLPVEHEIPDVYDSVDHIEPLPEEDVVDTTNIIDSCSLESQKIERPVRERHLPKWTHDYEMGDLSFSAMQSLAEPVNFDEALSCVDRSKWKSAMKEEYKSLMQNNAWILVDLPDNKRAIQSKWVFKIKQDCKGNVDRYRARLVAKGYDQKSGIDYSETFSPVVRGSTLRLLFALSVNMNVQIDHLDVKTAFLNGDLNEQVYMHQPQGFVVNGQEHKVCLLKKALYGLKQASRSWYEKIHNVLLKLNFKRCDYEPCVYIRCKENCLTVIAIYVDDILVFCTNTQEKCHLKNELMQQFEMKDLGEVKSFLGMRVCRKGNTIYVSQKGFIEQVLKRFGMHDCKPVCTPLEPKINLCKSETCDTNVPYQALIGCLMYLSTNTRPDIAFAASYLSQFNVCHSLQHWLAAKRVLRYLKGTSDLCLEFKRTGDNLIGYADADWGNDKTDRKSYTGFVFKLAGCAISWESKKQCTVALSSTEAEYMALSSAAKEAMFLQNVLTEVTNTKECVVIFNDNQSAQRLANNHICHGRTKHIDVQHHFIRKVIDDRVVNVEYVPTESMIADVLTKSLCKQKHVNCIKGLGLYNKNLD
jgi:hypothetical protein